MVVVLTVTVKKCTKKARCTRKVAVLPCQAVAFLTFSLSSPSWHLKIRIIYDCDRSETEFASETFFRLIGSSFVSGQESTK